MTAQKQKSTAMTRHPCSQAALLLVILTVRPSNGVHRHMHRDLMQVILRFRADQDAATALLRDRLGIIPPASNLSWARGLQESGETSALAIVERARALGMCVRPHGFGIAVALPEVTVDFDWGDRGEGYGFDLSRLWGHCRFNGLFLDVLTERLMTSYFQHAIAKGQLRKDIHLFYLPEERDRFTVDVDLIQPSHFEAATGVSRICSKRPFIKAP